MATAAFSEAPAELRERLRWLEICFGPEVVLEAVVKSGFNGAENMILSGQLNLGYPMEVAHA